MDFKKEDRHPSWVTVQFSRVSGQRTFFGSSVVSNSWVTLKVSKADRHNTFGRDKIMGKMHGDIVEVDLSPAQFSELLTTMNVGSGVPGTMTSFDGKEVDEYVETQHESIKVRNHFKDKMEERASKAKIAFSTISKTLEEKNTLNKTDKKIILDTLNYVINDFTSNIPFYLDQFNESADDIITQAKAEVESFVVQAVQQAGIESIKGSVQLIGHKDEI